MIEKDRKKNQIGKIARVETRPNFKFLLLLSSLLLGFLFLGFVCGGAFS